MQEPPRFGLDWLELREPYDRQARGFTQDIEEQVAFLRGRTDVRRCIDLGCGTGANIRVLAERIGGTQQWLAFDADAAVLEALPRTFERWSAMRGWRFAKRGARVSVDGGAFRLDIRTFQCDFASDRERIDLQDCDLVTASALLDLVSHGWLDDLVSRAARVGAAVHWALTYDGRTRWQIEDHDDAWVIAAFHRHQRIDKGFGPALGPKAADCARALLRQAGYQVCGRRSDWLLGQADAAMERALISGIAGAAAQMEPVRATAIDAWRQRRLAACARRGSGMRVGHRDVIARPGAAASMR